MTRPTAAFCSDCISGKHTNIEDKEEPTDDRCRREFFQKVDAGSYGLGGYLRWLCECMCPKQ